MGAWNPQMGLRPIRRAIWSLLPPMRAFGLTIVSVRNRGYLLTALENGPTLSTVKQAPVNRWEVSR
jgi:biotin operon repressor